MTSTPRSRPGAAGGPAPDACDRTGSSRPGSMRAPRCFVPRPRGPARSILVAITCLLLRKLSKNQSAQKTRALSGARLPFHTMNSSSPSCCGWRTRGPNPRIPTTTTRQHRQMMWSMMRTRPKRKASDTMRMSFTLSTPPQAPLRSSTHPQGPHHSTHTTRIRLPRATGQPTCRSGRCQLSRPNHRS